MHRYDGLVIYQDHDDEGVLEVVEKNGMRSLHFGSSNRQSTISLADPETLQLPYARAMMGWRLFKNDVKDILIVGLGGGSLARFLMHYYPQCRMTAVEYRASVVKVAHSHFGLPEDSRLSVVVGDGGAFVQQQAQQAADCYDLMIIDAFDVDGLADAVNSIAFFDACKVLLKPDGILGINLWETQKAITEGCFLWLERAFNDRVLRLPVRNRGNVIGMAFNKNIPRFSYKDLKLKALELENQYQIEFPLFLSDIRKHNPYTIYTLID
jgi:spermidine synthase